MDAENILHSPAIAQVMVNFAAEFGLSEADCLANTGISSEVLKDPNALIKRSQEMRLIENLMANLSHVPALGFELGSRYSTSTFGVWGFVLTTSKNLKEAAMAASRYLRLSTAYCSIHLEISDDELAIVMDAEGIPEHLRYFLRDRDLATGLNLARQVNLVSQPARRVELTGPRPEYAARVEELAALPVQYGAKRNRVVMPLQEALKPLPTYNERVVRQLEDQCRALLPQREISGIAEQVRAVLLAPDGFLKSAEEVAEGLGLSLRSLRRKLDAEDSSFRIIQEQARRELAEQMLSSTAMTIEELAFHLGYSDAASFTRAFRRSHEVSPGEYRAQHSA